ncbi:hypothetical protein JNM05_02755 [bacterium]|nr:hypothetical protein [bacterium]
MRPRIIYYAILIVISMIVMGSLAMSPGLHRENSVELDGMIYGTAPKPFVYRQLMPAAVRLTVQAIPSDVRNAMIEKASKSSTIARIMSRLKLSGELFVDYAVTVLFIYVSLWGFLLSFRFLIDRLYETTLFFADAVTAAALIGIPAFFGFSYIYDIPTLFLFTLGLGIMITRQWSLYLFFFFIGCWSKETMILLTLVFVIHFYFNKEMDRRLMKKLLAAQIGIFLSVKIILEIVFYQNPGGLIEFHFIHNLLFGYHYYLTTFLSWIVLALLLFYKWKEKPIFLKNALWIGVPLFVLTLFLGFLYEIRDYGELYPILIGLHAHSAAAILNIPCIPKENI